MTLARRGRTGLTEKATLGPRVSWLRCGRREPGGGESTCKGPAARASYTPCGQHTGKQRTKGEDVTGTARRREGQRGDQPVTMPRAPGNVAKCLRGHCSNRVAGPSTLGSRQEARGRFQPQEAGSRVKLCHHQGGRASRGGKARQPCPVRPVGTWVLGGGGRRTTEGRAVLRGQRWQWSQERLLTCMLAFMDSLVRFGMCVFSQGKRLLKERSLL